MPSSWQVKESQKNCIFVLNTYQIQRLKEFSYAINKVLMPTTIKVFFSGATLLIWCEKTPKNVHMVFRCPLGASLGIPSEPRSSKVTSLRVHSLRMTT